MGEYVDLTLEYDESDDDESCLIIEEDGLEMKIPLNELKDLIAGRKDTVRVYV